MVKIMIRDWKKVKEDGKDEEAESKGELKLGRNVWHNNF